MAKIMAVPADKLNLDFQGFSNKDFYQVIINNAIFRERELLEVDPEYKQPIPYLVFVKEGKVFCYKRTKKGGEGRLHDKYSIGIGGHIEQFDGKPEHALQNGLLREVEEELLEKPVPFQPKLIGYIYDGRDAVGQVHFGLLYLVEVTEDIKPNPEEAGEGMLLSVEEIKNLDGTLEGWSEIALEAIKQFI